MQAYEMMISPVIKVKETDTVHSVIEKFIENRISGLPVVNERNEMVGFISDGDIMRYIGKHEYRFIDPLHCVSVINRDNEDFEQKIRNLLELNVMSIAKRKVYKVSLDEEIENIASIFRKKTNKKIAS